MPASPIRKLAPFAAAAKARGMEIFHLNIGQPDVASPPEFWKALDEADHTNVAYSPSEGIPELREAMAKDYQKKGINVTPEQILTTTAGSEALVFAMTAILNPGEEVIVPEPMYANYIGFAVMAGVKAVPITTHIEDGFALPSVEDFEAKIGPKTKAILVCNPGNPTGTVYTDEQLEGLRDLAIKHDIFLIADEVYREFNYTGKPVKSMLQLEGIDDRVVMIDSVSKKWSLCGARLGFLVSRNEEVNQTALRAAQARLSPPTLGQIGTMGALTTPASYYEDVRSEYMKRRDLLVSRLRAMDGVVCPDINGAFYATVKLPVEDADHFCEWILGEFDLNGKTVMMAPASGFYETPGLGKQEVRIAYVLNCEKLGEAMDCVEAALKQYPGRTN